MQARGDDNIGPHPFPTFELTRRPFLAIVLAFALAAAGRAHAEVARRAVEPARAPWLARDDVRAFIAEMSAEHGFAVRDLERWLAAAKYQPKVVELMSRPVVEPPKWFEYSPSFLAPARVDAGVAFWSANQAALARAEERTGVPAEVIVAIIGVETFYGRYTGSHRVIDALATLAFDYPRRATFFRGELREFLLLAREQGFSPLVPKGSFAGAMGLPQFMPGSYRRYALDFDGSGRADLFGSAEDAVGSVANYLARHDWQRGQPVILAARLEPDKRDGVVRRLDGGLSERRSMAAWVEDGVVAELPPPDLAPEPVGVLMLEESATDASHWLAFHNFYVITRYNRSRLYATAVWRLAEALRAARGRA